MEKAREALMKAVDLLKEQGYNVVFVALYGAQNYNLQRPKSDFDFKAVVVPSLDDIVNNAKPTSLVVEGGEAFDGQVDVKDIRLMVDQWKKGATNFMELLFTDWQWVNPDFEPMNWFVEHRETIAKANPESALRAMLGMITEKHHALTHPYPVQVKEIEEFGFAGKQLSHELRLRNMMEWFFILPYSELLNPSKVVFPEDEKVQESRAKVFDFILKVKEQSAGLDLDSAKRLGQDTEDEAKALFEDLKARGVFEDIGINAPVLKKMDEKKSEIIKIALRNELLEG